MAKRHRPKQGTTHGAMMLNPLPAKERTNGDCECWKQSSKAMATEYSHLGELREASSARGRKAPSKHAVSPVHVCTEHLNSLMYYKDKAPQKSFSMPSVARTSHKLKLLPTAADATPTNSTPIQHKLACTTDITPRHRPATKLSAHETHTPGYKKTKRVQ